MIRPLRWTLILCILTSPAFGVDLEVSSRFDNLYWSPAHLDTAAGHTFDAADWFWNIQGSVTQDLADGLQFKGGVEVDPVLRSRAYAQLNFSLDNLSLKFSPFLDTFNSTQKWFNPGLEALVEYTWPGLIFVRGGFLTTFAPVSKAGDYYLSSQTAAVGFSMDNGIVTFNIVDKSATFRNNDAATVVDASTKYWLDTEMFLKNFPLRWAILTGLQITNRSYVGATETVTPVYAPLLGARFAWDFGVGSSVYLQGETAMFQWGWEQTTMDVPTNRAIVQVVVGTRYHW